MVMQTDKVEVLKEGYKAGRVRKEVLDRQEGLLGKMTVSTTADSAELPTCPFSTPSTMTFGALMQAALTGGSYLLLPVMTAFVVSLELEVGCWGLYKEFAFEAARVLCRAA